MDQTKPHKGAIASWSERHFEEGEVAEADYGPNLGYIILGRFCDHPRFAMQRGHTSLVVAREGNEIETLNSRYTLL